MYHSPRIYRGEFLLIGPKNIKSAKRFQSQLLTFYVFQGMFEILEYDSLAYTYVQLS